MQFNYVREVWDYNKANIKTFKSPDWKKAFENLSVDEKVDLLNETLFNIFWNYISNGKIKFNFCQPPWMDDKIKTYLLERTKFYHKNSQRKEDVEKLEVKAAYCTE